MHPRRPEGQLNSRAKQQQAGKRSLTAPEQQPRPHEHESLLQEIAAREAAVNTEQTLLREELKERRREVEKLRQQCATTSEQLFKTEQSILRQKKEKKAAKDKANKALSEYLEEQVRLVFTEAELEYRKQLAQGEQKMTTESLTENKQAVGDLQAELEEANEGFAALTARLRRERDGVTAATEAARRASLEVVTTVAHVKKTVKQSVCKPLAKHCLRHDYRTRTLAGARGHLKLRVARAREAVDRALSRELHELARTEELAATNRRDYWRQRNEARTHETELDDVISLLEGDAFFAPDKQDLEMRDQSLLEYRRLQKSVAAGGGGKAGGKKEAHAQGQANVDANNLQDGVLSRSVRAAVQALASAEGRHHSLAAHLRLLHDQTQRSAALLLLACQELYFLGLETAFDESERVQGPPSIYGGKNKPPVRLIRAGAAFSGYGAETGAGAGAGAGAGREGGGGYTRRVYQADRVYAAALQDESLVLEEAAGTTLARLRAALLRDPPSTPRPISNNTEDRGEAEDGDEGVVESKDSAPAPAPAVLEAKLPPPLSEQTLQAQQHRLLRQMTAVLERACVARTPLWEHGVDLALDSKHKQQRRRQQREAVAARAAISGSLTAALARRETHPLGSPSKKAAAAFVAKAVRAGADKAKTAGARKKAAAALTAHFLSAGSEKALTMLSPAPAPAPAPTPASGSGTKKGGEGRRGKEKLRINTSPSPSPSPGPSPSLSLSLSPGGGGGGSRESSSALSLSRFSSSSPPSRHQQQQAPTWVLRLRQLRVRELFNSSLDGTPQDPRLLVFLGPGPPLPSREGGGRGKGREEPAASSSTLSAAGTHGAWPAEEELAVPVSERDYMDGLELRFEVVNEQLRGFARVFYTVGEGSLRLDCIPPEQLDAPGGVEVAVRLTHGPSATRTGVIEMVAALHTHPAPAPLMIVAAAPASPASPASPADTNSPSRSMISPSIESGEGDGEGEEYADDFEEPPETPLAVAAARSGRRDLLGAVDDDDDGRGQELDDDIDDEDDEQQRDIINDDGGEGEGLEKAVPRPKFAWRRREIDFAVAKLYSVVPMDLDLSSLGIQLYDNSAAETRRAAKRAALGVIRGAATRSLLAL